jgi:hypothetical protein
MQAGSSNVQAASGILSSIRRWLVQLCGMHTIAAVQPSACSTPALASWAGQFVSPSWAGQFVSPSWAGSTHIQPFEIMLGAAPAVCSHLFLLAPAERHGHALNGRQPACHLKRLQMCPGHALIPCTTVIWHGLVENKKNKKKTKLTAVACRSSHVQPSRCTERLGVLSQSALAGGRDQLPNLNNLLNGDWLRTLFTSEASEFRPFALIAIDTRIDRRDTKLVATWRLEALVDLLVDLQAESVAMSKGQF